MQDPLITPIFAQMVLTAAGAAGIPISPAAATTIGSVLASAPLLGASTGIGRSVK